MFRSCLGELRPHESLGLAQYGALALVQTSYILAQYGAFLVIGVDDVAAARRTTAAAGALGPRRTLNTALEDEPQAVEHEAQRARLKAALQAHLGHCRRQCELLGPATHPSQHRIGHERRWQVGGAQHRLLSWHALGRILRRDAQVGARLAMERRRERVPLAPAAAARLLAHAVQFGEAIRGHSTSSEVIRGHQRPSEAIRGHPRPSEVFRGHQRPSEAIRGHQRPSEAIRGHQRSSEVIRGHHLSISGR